MLKNLNDGIEQNDNLRLEAVRFAWEKMSQPAAKNRLILNVHRVNSGSRRLNEESEQSKWGLMIIASSLSEGLSAWEIIAPHFQPAKTHEENAR